MRVLVAGATGVIGRRLMPLLTATGHEAVALSRHPRPAEGVQSVAADALDRQALVRAVVDAKPDAVVHLLTAIPAKINPRRMGRDFALTDRLRTEGTRNLLDAAREAGAGRVIAQGVAFAYEPGEGTANEDTPLWPDPPKQWARSLDAIRTLETLTGEAGGLVLRFGHLYGPGTAFDRDGWTTEQIRTRRMPLVGGGGSTFSFTHTHDAATAVVAALARPATGALNIVDDEPADIRTWLPELARIIGAPKPMTVPAPVARLMAGSFGLAYMTLLRGADNARARMELNWRPRYTSWREGFAAELGEQ